MSKRTEQVAEVIQRKLTEIISRELEFPTGVLVTITKVEISADLKNVTVHVVATPVDKMGLVYGILKKNIKTLRLLLGQDSQFPIVPKLNFRVDKTREMVDEVEELLEKIKTEENDQ